MLARRKAGMLTCVVCTREYYRPLASRTSKIGNYCSQPCYNVLRGQSIKGVAKTEEHKRNLSQSLANRPRGERHPSWKGGPRIVVCEHCDGPFEVSRSNPNATTARFCSTRCWYAYVRLHPEASGAFRGGREPYYGPNWPEQARAARKRDGYTCQDCDKHQVRPALDVHHLKPRRTFNGDYIAANQLDNLVSLCKACHTSRERILTAELIQV